MADNDTKAGDVNNDSQQADTVSLEDFNNLKNMFDQVQSAQKGSDKKVQELTDLLKQKDELIEEEKGKAKTANMDKVDQLSEQLQKMAESMEATKRDADRKQFLADGYKLATNLKVPTDLIDNYGGNPEGLEEYLTKIKEANDAQIQAAINEGLAGGYKPNNGNNGSNGSAAWNPKEHSKQENEEHYKSLFTGIYDAKQKQAT